MGHACFGFWAYVYVCVCECECLCGYRFFSAWIIFHWHHHHTRNELEHMHVFINGHLLLLISEKKKKEKWFAIEFPWNHLYLSAIKLRTDVSHTANMIDECILKFINCEKKPKSREKANKSEQRVSEWASERERDRTTYQRTTGAACRIQSNSFGVFNQTYTFDVVCSSVLAKRACVRHDGKCKS